MMLTFIFKYTWIGMIISVYIIWSIKSIKDIVSMKRIWKDSFDTYLLDDGTLAWIGVTLFGIFVASFVHWLFGVMVE